MTIEFGHYGFMIDTHYAYIALSWELLITASIVTALVIAYKKWNNRK